MKLKRSPPDEPRCPQMDREVPLKANFCPARWRVRYAMAEAINTGVFRMSIITKCSLASVPATRGGRLYSALCNWSQSGMTLWMLSVALCVLTVITEIDTAFASGHYCSEYGRARHCHSMWSRDFKKCVCVG